MNTIPAARFQLDSFQTWLETLGKSSSTTDKYVRLLAAYEGYSQGKSSPVEAWIQWPTTPQVRRLTGFALRLYAKFCQEFGLPAGHFHRPSKLPPASKPNPNPLSRREILQILAAARGLKRPSSVSLRAWILMLFETGMRRSEAANLTWNDVGWHPQNPSIRVLGKGNKERILPISGRLLKILAYLRNRNPKGLWQGSRGNFLSGNDLAHLFKVAATAAGIPDAHPHRIRHLRLTALAQRKDFNPFLFCAFSGHRSLKSAQYYVQPQLEDLRKYLGR